MAYAFAPISAKPTFGTLRDNLFQSDYIKLKKSKHILCRCRKICRCSCNRININTGNLIMGQYTKLDLTDVCTVIPTTPCPTTPCNLLCDCEPCITKDPVPIVPDQENGNPFYFSNTIDPIGALFGNSQCGEQNYIRYMVWTKK
jgi:hypothetical protein